VPRPRLQGGLGATLLFQFFLSLFTRQIFKSLIHPDAIERTASVYWLGPHLKNHLQQIIQPRFDSTHSSHPYFTTSLSSITDLLKAGIFTSSTASNHRPTYNHLTPTLDNHGQQRLRNRILTGLPSGVRWAKSKEETLNWSGILTITSSPPTSVSQVSNFHPTTNTHYAMPDKKLTTI